MTRCRNTKDDFQSIEEQREFKKYCHTFVRDFHGPYAVQKPDIDWRTRHKPIADPLIRAHLRGDYWIAAKAAWYPAFYYLDVDGAHPRDKTAGRPFKIADQIIEKLGLHQGQYQMMTSPSYRTKGSIHITLRLEYRENLPTHRIGYEALINTIGDQCEIYPQSNRKFRLPLGRDQFLLSADKQVLDRMSWQDAMYWLEKLDPVSIESLNYQEDSAEDSTLPLLIGDKAKPWIEWNQEEAHRLYTEGLQGPNTRHHVQWKIAIWLFRQNLGPEYAVKELKNWIHKKHNEFSQSVKGGKWREIHNEIERQVHWIWRHFRIHSMYPDAPNNLDGAITAEDLKFIVNVYPGDIVNQKRLSALICYYRPRAHHKFVYIPQRVWRNGIANDRTYQGFINDLETKGLLETNRAYRHVVSSRDLSYSRKYRLALPSRSSDPIQNDGRNEHDYYEALFLTFGSIREMVAFTGVTHQPFYYHKKKKGLDHAKNTPHIKLL